MRGCRLGLVVIALVPLAACESTCPASERVVIGGEAYCGSPCSTCDACASGFTCVFPEGVCVDQAFLSDRGQSTVCRQPCPTGEVRFNDMGSESCVRTCTVDGECSNCCFEPPDLEVRICAPRLEICP